MTYFIRLTGSSTSAASEGSATAAEEALTTSLAVVLTFAVEDKRGFFDREKERAAWVSGETFEEKEREDKEDVRVVIETAIFLKL